MTYTVYLLSQHPKVEERLVAELDEVFGGQTPAMTDLPPLTYLERIAKELMRLFPPVPSTVREAVEPDIVSRDEIPASATIHLPQWIVYCDPRWYDEALSFWPERWTREMEHSLPRMAYFPFAADSRRCIGDRFAMLKARLLIATISNWSPTGISR